MIALPGQVMSIIEVLLGFIGIRNIWLKDCRDTGYLRKKIKGIFKIDIPGCKLEF